MSQWKCFEKTNRKEIVALWFFYDTDFTYLLWLSLMRPSLCSINVHVFSRIWLGILWKYEDYYDLVILWTLKLESFFVCLNFRFHKQFFNVLTSWCSNPERYVAQRTGQWLTTKTDISERLIAKICLMTCLKIRDKFSVFWRYSNWFFKKLHISWRYSSLRGHFL